jgi:hypothetical protein
MRCLEFVCLVAHHSFIVDDCFWCPTSLTCSENCDAVDNAMMGMIGGGGIGGAGGGTGDDAGGVDNGNPIPTDASSGTRECHPPVIGDDRCPPHQSCTVCTDDNCFWCRTGTGFRCVSEEGANECAAAPALCTDIATLSSSTTLSSSVGNVSLSTAESTSSSTSLPLASVTLSNIDQVDTSFNPLYYVAIGGGVLLLSLAIAVVVAVVFKRSQSNAVKVHYMTLCCCRHLFNYLSL